MQNMRQEDRITHIPEQAESDDEQRDCEGRVTPDSPGHHDAGPATGQAISRIPKLLRQSP